jgi:hypothetical protein
VFKNGVLRKIFGSKWEKVVGDCRKLNSDELRGLYSPNIIQVTKSSRIKWVGHGALMGEKITATEF